MLQRTCPEPLSLQSPHLKISSIWRLKDVQSWRGNGLKARGVLREPKVCSSLSTPAPFTAEDRLAFPGCRDRPGLGWPWLGRSLSSPSAPKLSDVTSTNWGLLPDSVD